LEFEGFYCVGWVHSAHGIRGELFLRLHAEQADWLDEIDEIALAPRNVASPKLQIFSIQTLREHKNGLIAKLHDLVDRNASELLRGHSVYIRENALSAKPGERIFLAQVQGFTLVDQEGVTRGRVVDFATNSAQDLLVVAQGEGRADALVPFIDEFLVSIDFEKHNIFMQLPPGLFE